MEARNTPEASVTPMDKTAALQALEQAKNEGVLLTGLLYVDAKRQDFNTVLNLVEKPLASLTEAEARPTRQVLEQILADYR